MCGEMQARPAFPSIMRSVSAREDQPATVPPPAGEDDAYSAATKVGAMPADLMARLRAEGLLPGDVEDAPSPPSQHSAAPATPSSAPATGQSRVPVVHSAAPPQANVGGPEEVDASALLEEEPAPPPLPLRPVGPEHSGAVASSPAQPRTEPSGFPAQISSQGPRPLAVQTPIAFVTPPAPQPLSAPPPASPELGTPYSVRGEPVAPLGKSRRSGAVVGVIAALVVALFVVALVTMRR